MSKAKTKKRHASASPVPPSPHAADDVRILARDAALAALTRLAELANSEDERIALAASQELLNRAFGKSASAASDEPTHAGQPLVVTIIRFGADPDDADVAAVRKRGDRP